MIATLKIIKIGKSAGIVLPDEVLAKLNAGIGDELEVVLTPGGIEIRAKGR
jgi:antitoxin component of MazEF toxin-antitoxin module